MRESFIIYKSFFEAGEQIRNKVDRLLFYEAIFKFALFQEECELSGVAKGMFVLVKPQLEANLRKFENGKKPKQNRSKVEANDKQNGSKTEGNVNDNVNVNENDNDECKNTPISTSPSTSFFSISECRAKYDSDFIPTKLALCDKHSIGHKLLVIFQNEFDKELLATGKTQKVLNDYIDHFAKWINLKGVDGRKLILTNYHIKNNPQEDVSAKYM